MSVTSLYRYDQFYRCTIQISKDHLVFPTTHDPLYYLYVRDDQIALFSFEADHQLECGMWNELWDTAVEGMLVRCCVHPPLPSQRKLFEFTAEGTDVVMEIIDAVRAGIIAGEKAEVEAI
jgi:hypothetical protein